MISIQGFKSIHPVIRWSAVFVVCFVLFTALYVLVVSNSEPTENTVSYNDNNSNVFNLSIPSRLNFCGEELPTNDVRIKAILEKEFRKDQYSRSATQLLFNKAQRWFGYIEPVLKQQGIPDDFKYLAVIESHLSNVHSPAGAAGFWQLIANSAVNYGLTVNSTVDERLHVEKATRAACELIKQAYKVLKNWTLSAAAYNRGINGILRAMKDQNTRDYHQLLLNPETGAFVYRILAYKTLLSKPIHFGINKKNIKPLPKIPYNVVRVDSSIQSLASFADYLGTDFVTLKGHNPWLIAGSLENPNGLVFEIKLPRNKKADYSKYLMDLNPYQVVVAKTSEIRIDSLQSHSKENTVFIENETTIEELAKQFHVKTEDLRRWNGFGPDKTTVRSQSVVVIEPIAPER